MRFSGHFMCIVLGVSLSFILLTLGTLCNDFISISVGVTNVNFHWM